MRTSNWNELYVDVMKIKNVKSFKKKLYTNLITKQRERGNFEYLLNIWVAFYNKSVK